MCKWGSEICEAVSKELEKLGNVSTKIRNGEWRGYDGKRIKSVVNIGIGGSDLGPRMVCRAMKHFCGMEDPIEMHFISNIDGNDILSVLERCDPSTTLFIIVSKTFTTVETLTNARSARRWILNHFSQKIECCQKHFIAVSPNVDAVVEFGIPHDDEHIFVFWDWVGGRYSTWSSAGISICIYIGYENFLEFLKRS